MSDRSPRLPAAGQLRSRAPMSRAWPPTASSCDEAERDYEGYWARLARELISWKTPFTNVARREQGAVLQVVRGRHAERLVQLPRPQRRAGLGDKTAIIFEADDGTVTQVTYSELLERTCQLANALKARGVNKGDRVVIYMPMSIEGVVAMQACARIGATHSVVFGGFSAQSLRDRIDDTGAVMVITADEQMRGGKALPLKAIVDEALGWAAARRCSDVIVYQRTGGKVDCDRAARQVAARAGRPSEPTTCEPEWVSAEHPLFLLYTSGSTGKPKGVQHSHRRLPAARGADDEVDLRPEARRRLLVHRRHRLGHRPHLHRLRAARARRHRGRVRGRADLSRTPAASGRRSQSTRSRSSTPRRRRSAR